MVASEAEFNGIVRYHEMPSEYLLRANADGHGIVPDGFDLKIAGSAQFPCTVLLYGASGVHALKG